VLVASTATAQPPPPARQRQDRRAVLPTTAGEPLPELYVAGGSLTMVAFNGPLDRDSLVVDRTRFKWVDVGDRLLGLEPFEDLAPGERLIMQVGFKDRAQPAKAVIAVLSRADVVDGKVEMDRRANTPEALLAALAQKEAELEELEARCEGSGPVGLVVSGWLTRETEPSGLVKTVDPAGTSGLRFIDAFGYAGTHSTLVVLQLGNPPGQRPWSLGQARITSATGAPVKVLTARVKQKLLAPGEEGQVIVETQASPWATGRTFNVELVDADGQRRLSLNLLAK
jgi:uncharacterized protein (TIGR02268 family)